MSLSRRTIVKAALACGAWPIASRAEAAWPAARDVRIVVPFQPGGTTDYVARLVGGEVGASVGQSVLIADIIRKANIPLEG